jgi:hypothetical protein
MLFFTKTLTGSIDAQNAAQVMHKDITQPTCRTGLVKWQK